MSLSMIWYPTTEPKSFQNNYFSKDKEHLENVFGSFPLTLNHLAIAQLEVMDEMSGGVNIYQEIIERLRELGEITIDCSY